jgi:hypothetical protein
MERTRNFKGQYEGGHDQHLGNVYNGPVYIGGSTDHKATDPGTESGNSKKLPSGPNDDENKKPSLEGMLRSRKHTNKNTNSDRIP